MRDEFNNFRFYHGYADGTLKMTLYVVVIQVAISLDPWTLDRRSLSTIQQAKLDTRVVGGAPHQTIERIDLSDKVSLADTPERGVTRHNAEVLAAEGDESCPCAHATCSIRRFGSGVPSADNDHIELFHVKRPISRYRSS